MATPLPGGGRPPGVPDAGRQRSRHRSASRYRRAFVAHYCNARSYLPWDDEPVEPGEVANGRHILARGNTHLPYARPQFAAR